MPGIFHRPLNRREFLAHSAKGLAASALASSWLARSTIAADSDTSFHIALFSDTHVAADPKNENRKFLPAENLKLVAAQIRDAGPQAALLNGDLARLTGELEDYQAVEKLLTPIAEQCPVYISMGNHDHRENFHKVFHSPADLTQKIAEKHVLVVEEPLLRMVILDSLFYVNKSPGLLGKAQRDWLDKFLAKSDGRPTILFVHHTLGENDGELLDAEALLRIARPYAKVKAIFYGHSHEYSYRHNHGIHLINLPAVGYNFSDQEPVGWVDARFTAAGAELTLKAFGGNLAQDGQTTALTWRNS